MADLSIGLVALKKRFATLYGATGSMRC